MTSANLERLFQLRKHLEGKDFKFSNLHAARKINYINRVENRPNDQNRSILLIQIETAQSHAY